MHKLLDDIVDDDWTRKMRALIEETRRRSPVTRVACIRHLNPDQAKIEEIREYKAAFPDEPYRSIANALNTSIRCVSLALAGSRDGRPVDRNRGERHAAA
jgi:hypothetical protein